MAIYPDRNGEAREIPDEVVNAIEDAAFSLTKIIGEMVKSERDVKVAQKRLADLRAKYTAEAREAADLLPRDLLFPAGGGRLIVERVTGRRQNRSVDHDAIDALNEELPELLRRRNVATIDARYLSEGQLRLAEVKPVYPSVALVDDSQYLLASRGIPLARILDIPPDPPDELRVRPVE